MSILATGEYKLLRRSHSLPHIASRHDSGVSGITATTNTTTGSCNLLDHIDYDSALGNEHHFNNQTRRYNKVKYHNYHHHNHHQQYENVRHKIRLFNCLVILATFCAPLPSPYHLHNLVCVLVWCMKRISIFSALHFCYDAIHFRLNRLFDAHFKVR